MIRSEHKRWYAVHVPFRREKSAAQRLSRMGVDTYVPLIEKTRRYVRKVKRYEIPLINKYIFVHIDPSDYVRVLSERDVIGFLRFGREVSPIPDEEIATLKRVVGDHSIQVEMMEDVDWLGSEVEIIHGQLTGLKGRVKDVLGKKKLLVHLDTLGMTMGIEVAPKYLSPVMA